MVPESAADHPVLTMAPAAAAISSDEVWASPADSDASGDSLDVGAQAAAVGSGDGLVLDQAKLDRVNALLEPHHYFIYTFPQRVMGVGEDECAEFYVYAVEQIRKRDILGAEKYVEREGARFETWLSVVLRNLYIDLKRATREPRVDLSDTLEATAAAPKPSSDQVTDEDENIRMASRALAVLDPRQRVLFKLLLLGDLYLSAEDLEVLAERTGKPIDKLLGEITELEGEVAARSQREKDRHEELTRVFWWVEHYRDKLQRTISRYGDNEATWPAQVAGQIQEMRRKLAKRRRQHAEVVRTYYAAGLTVKASYESIAKILDTTRDAVKMEAYRARRAYIEATDREAAAASALAAC